MEVFCCKDDPGVRLSRSATPVGGAPGKEAGVLVRSSALPGMVLEFAFAHTFRLETIHRTRIVAFRKVEIPYLEDNGGLQFSGTQCIFLANLHAYHEHEPMGRGRCY